MKYKKISITAFAIIILCVFVIIYFCFASLSASYGYKNSWAEDASNNIDNGLITVIIDAGHGGIDPGATANGLIEKELNLAVAKKLETFLKLANVNVVLTRNDDILLGDGDTVRAHKTADLKERLKILEQTENSLFVSVHMNKFTSESVHGLQTFYASSTEKSSRLAQCIQNSAKLIDSDNKREIKPDDKNIYILENATKTAVLVECGFISNQKEASLLSTEEYQNKLAFAIFAGIIKYIQENEL